MKILMTGSQGFVGSLLRKRFSSSSWEIHGFSGDILDINDIKNNFPDGCNWDFVIHLAGMGSVPDCDCNPVKAFEVNSIGTFLIAEAIKKNCPRAQLIFASTGQVYDLFDGLDTPVTELQPIRPANAYAKTKRAAELYIEDCFKSFGGSYVILRMFNHSHKSQRPDFFMPSIYQQILEKQKTSPSVELEVGNVNLERDIGAVQDLVEAFYQVVKEHKREQEIYNLCSGVGKSLGEVIKEMSRVLDIDVKLNVIQERMRQGDPPRMVASCAKFSRDFNWSPKFARNEKELVVSFLKDISEGGM